MLFNSCIFLFLYLPLFLIGWQIAARSSLHYLPLYLLISSLIFYGCFGLQWLILLLLISGGNWFFGLAIAARPADSGSAFLSRRAIFICGLLFNLLPLLWFKYSWFIFENISLLLNIQWEFTPPAFPLGISFYTFIQIAWLAGVYKSEQTPGSLKIHALFSCCFPYLISGPIVRADQMEWQFTRLTALSAAGLASGLTLFTAGLAKKVIFADSLGFYADAVFNAAAKNWPLSAMEAWAGALAYTFQLYFDFSGYTDMALGIGLMIGLTLPENFNSPYKSTGIIEFWRRWHITLGSWLRDFLYIPLGGNRHGKIRHFLNLFLTMLIGGIWHGAGWTYMIWGAMHGAMLCVNHSFRTIIRKHDLIAVMQKFPVRIFSILLTFFFLNLTWVIFRADSIDAAIEIYKAMFSFSAGEQPVANGAALAYADIFSYLLPNHYFSGLMPLFLLAISFFVCWLLPNSRQIINGEAGLLSWRLNNIWSAATAVVCFLALTLLSRNSTFLYFQF